MNVQNAPKKTVNTAPVAPLPLPTTNYHQTYRHSRANYLYELPLSTQARASCGASGASSRREQPRLVIGARGRVVVDDLQRKVSGHLVHLHGKYVFTVFVTETKTTVFHCFSKQVDSYLVEYGRGGCVLQYRPSVEEMPRCGRFTLHPSRTLSRALLLLVLCCARALFTRRPAIFDFRYRWLVTRTNKS